MKMVSRGKEIWKPVPGFGDKYEASSKGRLRQVKGNACSAFRPRYIRDDPGERLYAHLSVTVDGVTRTCTVHQLVALAFLGPCPEEMEVNHIDLDKLNNRPDNLEYVTHQANIRHARAAKRWYARTDLTDDQVRSIRMDTRLLKEIATDYGISQATVCYIRQRKSWKHVED